MSIFVGQAAFDYRAHFFHQTFPAAEIFGFDRGVKDYLDLSGLDRESGFWHRIVRADDRHWDYGNRALRRQIERAFLKWEQLAVVGALPFHIDDHVEAFFDYGLGFAYRFDSRITIAPVHRNEVAH